MNAGILEQVRDIDRHCLSLHTDHVLAKLHHTTRAGCGDLILRHAAAEVNVCSSVIIHQNSRVKKPQYIRTVGRISGDQFLADGVSERSHGAVCGQHADAAAGVCEIQEELRLAVDHLPGSRGRPGIACPLGGAVLAGNLNGAVVCEVHHIVRGNHIDAANLAVCILLDLTLCIILKGVSRHVNIKSSVILHGVRVCAEPLGHDGVGIV